MSKSAFISYYSVPDGTRRIDAELARIIDTLSADPTEQRVTQMVRRAFNLGLEVAAQDVDNARFDSPPSTARLIRNAAVPETSAYMRCGYGHPNSRGSATCTAVGCAEKVGPT